ncbi:YfdX family protein [Parasulfuritortus cantonensis]|uniref:YfdX family protein n=1 Tax=Parasulfuritortus cantonensis TaxID=2528202 RepID=A0A4R1B5K6_9PROT|nr:YfdX family protein [Parasulfuritortus cantonensis]TCJ13424.1 YfdX family protein [Parasulfuritortus cantonensis]
MTKLRIRPLVIALAATLAAGPAAYAAESQLHEEVTSTPGRGISRADEDMVSSAAGKVLNHIARARDALRKKDAEQAGNELRQASTLMDIIDRVAPTTVIKDRMWTNDHKLSYEDTQEVHPAAVPVYSVLDERTLVDDVAMPGKAAEPAAKSERTLKAPVAKTEAGKRLEPEAADVMVYYEELDLPLRSTRHFIAAAQSELGRNRLNEADQALRAAQDSVDFVGLFLPEPLLAARDNLARAHEHYSAGKVPEAKEDVDTAIAQLEDAKRAADPDSQADVGKLLDDAKSLRGRIERGETSLAGDIKGLWHHTEALADRAMESTAVGWAKLRHHGQVRADLIEAKRYVVYADVDGNVDRAPERAHSDLTKARDFLDKAAAASAGKTDAEVYIKDAKAMVDSILSGQAKADPGELANLKNQVVQAMDKV